MECSSQKDVVNEFADITKSGSEIYLDDVFNNNNESNDTRNKTDIFSDVLTAIEESFSRLSVNTALTEESMEQSLNAHADPSLNTTMTFSTASDLSEVEHYESSDDPFYRNPLPLQVWRNKNRITGFEMLCDEKKVTVVDSLECLDQCLQYDLSLKPVHFDPRVYLGVPYSDDDYDEFRSMDSVSTAHLGPTSEEFEDWVREVEKSE